MKFNNRGLIVAILGVFLLGGVIIINTISAAPIEFDGIDLGIFEIGGSIDGEEVEKMKGIPHRVEDKTIYIDPENKHHRIYFVVYLLDDDDNYLGFVQITGGVELQEDGRYYVYGSSFADTATDVDGLTFAQGQLAGRDKQTDGPHRDRYASAWDAFHRVGFPAGSGNGRAELTVGDVTMWISVDGAI